jgi:hypothetical protein
MSPELISQYQISFQNKIIDFEKQGKVIYKILSTNNSFISEFFLDWRNGIEIQDYLLPDIESILNNEEDEIQVESETFSVLMYQNKVVFYPENHDTFEIPTLDFKEIAIAWRDFLLEPPLNGSKA